LNFRFIIFFVDNIQEPSKISPGDGVVVKRAIPDDNSCLFNAVSYPFQPIYFLLDITRFFPSLSIFDFNISYVLDRNNTAQNLRNYIATMVLQDPKSYSEAVLGRPNQQYAEWIKHKDHWGGMHFSCLILSVPSVTLIEYEITPSNLYCFLYLNLLFGKSNKGAIELAILSKYYKCEIVAFDVANLHPHCFGTHILFLDIQSFCFSVLFYRILSLFFGNIFSLIFCH
jgi:hypothetical protein